MCIEKNSRSSLNKSLCFAILLPVMLDVWDILHHYYYHYYIALNVQTFNFLWGKKIYELCSVCKTKEDPLQIGRD